MNQGGWQTAWTSARSDRHDVLCPKKEDRLRTPLVSMVLAALLLIGAAPGGIGEDIRDHPDCPICGMDRQQYAHSRMLIDYQEGPVGTCSIHCTAADIAVNRHKRVRGIFVADYSGRQLIPATMAFWVIGGNRSGVMTQRAKWAFENKADAQAFIREHGGSLANFDEAVKATFEDMYADIKAVRERGRKQKARGMR